MPEQTPMVVEEKAEDGHTAAPVNGGSGENYIPATVSDGQNEGYRKEKINVADKLELLTKSKIMRHKGQRILPRVQKKTP